MEYCLEMKTFFMAMFPSYRNQSIDLHYKSVDWFLYEVNIAMKKVKQQITSHLVYNNLFKKLKYYATPLNF